MKYNNCGTSSNSNRSGVYGSPFKTGDVVRLVSGSPKLVVSHVHADYRTVTVVWIAYGSGTPHEMTGCIELFEQSRD